MPTDAAARRSVFDVRPLDRIGSIRTKFAFIIIIAVGVSAAVSQIGLELGIRVWLRPPIAIVISLLIVRVLARGTTSPLREMERAAAQIARGDYSHRESKYIAPCFEILKELRAPLGVYGVLGNHDYWHGVEETRAGMKRAGIEELTNRGVWLTRRQERLRLAGVDDLWCGQTDLAAALDDATLRDMRAGLEENDFRIQNAMETIVASPQFLTKRGSGLSTDYTDFTDEE